MELTPGYETWSELDLLAGVIVGEARGESTAGMIGVGITVMTRVSRPCWWGRNVREVVLKPKQFSCWGDMNAVVIKDARRFKNSTWKICHDVAMQVYTGSIQDTIGGPTHYHTTAIFPDWASSMKRLATLGNHIFYRDTKQMGDGPTYP